MVVAISSINDARRESFALGSDAACCQSCARSFREVAFAKNPFRLSTRTTTGSGLGVGRADGDGETVAVAAAVASGVAAGVGVGTCAESVDVEVPDELPFPLETVVEPGLFVMT